MLVHWRLSTSSSLIRCTRSFCYVTVRNLTGFLTTLTTRNRLSRILKTLNTFHHKFFNSNKIQVAVILSMDDFFGLG